MSVQKYNFTKAQQLALFGHMLLGALQEQAMVALEK